MACVQHIAMEAFRGGTKFECLLEFVYAQGYVAYIYAGPYWFILESFAMQFSHYISSINLYQKKISLLRFLLYWNLEECLYYL